MQLTRIATAVLGTLASSPVAAKPEGAHAGPAPRPTVGDRRLDAIADGPATRLQPPIRGVAPGSVQPLIGPPTAVKLAEARGTLLHPGQGCLVHLGVTHLLAGAPASDALWQAATESQLAALDALFTLKPAHLFVEGLSFDVGAREFPDPAAQQVRDAFRGWLPGQPLSRWQGQLLAKVSAPRVYTVLSGAAISLHKTTSAAVQAEVQRGLGVADFVGPGPASVRRRDADLVAELTRFLAAPGPRDAVVVFGAVHDLGRYLGGSPDFSPTLYFHDVSGFSQQTLRQTRALMYQGGEEGPEVG